MNEHLMDEKGTCIFGFIVLLGYRHLVITPSIQGCRYSEEVINYVGRLTIRKPPHLTMGR